MRLSSTLSNHTLKTSSDGDSTTSLRRLLQPVIVLTVKNLFLISRQYLSQYNLYLLLLLLSMWLLTKRELLSSL